MKKERILNLLKQFAGPGLLILVGLVLLVSPDTATVLVSKIIGWVLVVIGAGMGISMADRRGSSAGGWIVAAVCVAAGVFLLKNPMILADVIGRVIGALLALYGLHDLRRSHYSAARVLSLIAMVAGIVLIFLPRTLTQTIFGLCGLVLVILGVVELLDKLRRYKRLEDGSRPTIIDADE